MKCTYPKRGSQSKHAGNKRTGAKNGREELAHTGPYRERMMMGKSEEVRMRNVFRNDYGKKAQPEKPQATKIPGVPIRTVISIG